MVFYPALRLAPAVAAAEFVSAPAPVVLHLAPPCSFRFRSRASPGNAWKESDVPCTTTRFSSAEAPCGRFLDGEVFQDDDEQVVMTREMDFSCGCRIIRHEYHDGAVAEKVVHHNGTVLVDTMTSAE